MTMNELIEQLRRQLNKGETTFGDAIQTACKAQRNACARVYERDYIDKGGYNIHDYIVDAEIERCDYE